MLPDSRLLDGRDQLFQMRGQDIEKDRQQQKSWRFPSSARPIASICCLSAGQPAREQVPLLVQDRKHPVDPLTVGFDLLIAPQVARRGSDCPRRSMGRRPCRPSGDCTTPRRTRGRARAVSRSARQKRDGAGRIGSRTLTAPASASFLPAPLIDDECQNLPGLNPEAYALEHLDALEARAGSRSQARSTSRVPAIAEIGLMNQGVVTHLGGRPFGEEPAAIQHEDRCEIFITSFMSCSTRTTAIPLLATRQINRSISWSRLRCTRRPAVEQQYPRFGRQRASDSEPLCSRHTKGRRPGRRPCREGRPPSASVARRLWSPISADRRKAAATGRRTDCDVPSGGGRP